MNDAPTHFCRLGAIGWEHDSWVGAFYPEDLPAEWRLSYYNTQFDCVFLPYPQWSHTPVQTLEAWAQDTLSRFRFLLEHAPGTSAPGDAVRLAALGEKAVLLTPAQRRWVVGFDATTPLKDLADRLKEKAEEAWTVGEPLWLISLDADLPRIEAVRTLLELLGY